HAPNQRGHAQKFERARCHIAAAEAVRALARSVEHVAAVIGDHPVKDVVLRHIVQKLWSAVASSPARLILFRVMNLDGNEVLRIRIRERLHEYVFNDAENGRGRADAQREGNYRNDSKTRAFPEVSSGVVEILPE